jgi:hypothetical protein
LQRLEFSPLTEEGEANLIAQASAPKTVAKKKKKPTTRTAAVVMQVRLVYDRPALPAIEAARRARGLSPLQFEQQRIPRPRSGAQPPGSLTGMQDVAPIGTPPSEQFRYGTMLARPAPGAQEVRIVSWNSGAPIEGSNASHAERFFQEWWVHQGPGQGLKEVHVTINFSPCSLCVGSLPDLTRAGATGTLAYQIAFEGRDRRTKILYSNSTTTEDLGLLGRKGWTVSGPAPKWTNATKEAERRAGWSILSRAY